MIAGLFTSEGSDSGDDLYIDGVVVATNKRLLAVDRGMFGNEDVAEIDYTDIRDIRHEEEAVHIIGLHMTYKIESIFEDGVEDPFVNYVLARMGRTSLEGNPPFHSSPESRLCPRPLHPAGHAPVVRRR